jgi:hypothetical protein
MGGLSLYIIVTTGYVDSINLLLRDVDDIMNGDRKFREIYDKFGGSYGDLIIEHIRVLKELEKCQKQLIKQKNKE